MKLLTVLLPLFLAACAQKPAYQADSTDPELSPIFAAADGDARPTDMARFLAGRPVRDGAVLSRLQMTGEYRAFSRDALEKWKFRTSRRIAAQQQWESRHIRPLVGTRGTVLYPFGGPDLLYSMALFPDSARYILLGLEPVGNVPDLERTEPAAVIAALDRHAKSMETELLHGYFITKDMRTDFANGPLQGVTPILLSELGFMRAEIAGVRSIDAGGNPGVAIDFTLPGRGRKTVIYISGDLSNGSFGKMTSWLSAHAGGSLAYFKAASYLMQDAGFTSARDWVLGNCGAIVQDDSGIPYAAFDEAKWDIHLFGTYDGPIGFFGKHKQDALLAAYRAAGPLPPLTFGSGYEMKAAVANLLIATRR